MSTFFTVTPNIWTSMVFTVYEERRMSLFQRLFKLTFLCLLVVLVSMIFLFQVSNHNPKSSGKEEKGSFDSTNVKNEAVDNNFDGANVDVLSTIIAHPVNVLLLAYPRSGSSFLGEILSCHPESMYVFEPLVEIQSKRNMRTPSAARSAIKGLFYCNTTMLDIVGKNRLADLEILRKVGRANLIENNSTKSCLETQIKVIKTIRLRMDVAKPLLDESRMKLKIVHLVRDPRAIFNSLQKNEIWSNVTKSAPHQCAILRRDISVGSQLPNDRYIRVRYEDLIENPLGMAVKLYEFLRIPLHSLLAFYLTTHTESERFFKYHHQKSEYFSTYRKSTYDTKSWRKTMTESTRKKIELVCSDVIQTLAYS